MSIGVCGSVSNQVQMLMNIRFRVVPAASLAFMHAIWLSTGVGTATLKEARVTLVVQDVRLLPSNAAPRPASVNDPVRAGTAVRTCTQSRSELTLTDLTITRLGANTMLHAWKLGFRHPGTGGWKSFQAPLPDDFATAMKMTDES